MTSLAKLKDGIVDNINLRPLPDLMLDGEDVELLEHPELLENPDLLEDPALHQIADGVEDDGEKALLKRFGKKLGYDFDETKTLLDGKKEPRPELKLDKTLLDEVMKARSGDHLGRTQHRMYTQRNSEAEKLKQESPTPPVLKNPRFRKDPELAQVAAGECSLGKGEHSESVRRVQSALSDLGYKLPRYGVDGKLGNETLGALNRFLKDKKLAPRQALDAEALLALDKAAPTKPIQVAPKVQTQQKPKVEQKLEPKTQPKTQQPSKPQTDKPKAAKQHGLEYDKLLKDGVVYATLAVGYDEDGLHNAASKKLKDGMAQRGFSPYDVANKSDAQLKADGFDPAKIDRKASYYRARFTRDGKQNQVLARMVDPNSKDAKAQFAKGFAQDELLIYDGHARYGSGPDFDAIGSGKGNFVIGVNAKGHKDGTLKKAAIETEHTGELKKSLANAPNDLERTKMTDDYQMMVMLGCTTQNYADELRKIPANKNRKNLDLIVSDEELPWSAGADSQLSVLDGLMKGQSSEQIIKRLTELNKAKLHGDGFGDNPLVP